MRNIARIIITMLFITMLSIVNVYSVNANTVMLATVNSSQTNFKVRFSGKPQVSNENKVKATVTNDLSATINVTGLTMDENIETVTYVVQNTSVDLSAELSLEAINNNTEYFSIEPKIEKKTLAKGEATTIIIKIKLIKKPVGESEKATIGIQLTATPIQPTENNNGNSANNNNTVDSYSAENNTNINSNSRKPSRLGTTSTTSNQRIKDETPKTGDLKFIDIIWR